MKRTYGTLAFAALVVSLAFTQSAFANMFLPPENDCWITQVPATQSTLPAIPAGFFGAGSDAIPAGRIVKLVGNPLSPATVAANCPEATRVQLVYPGCHVPGLDPNTCHLVAQRVTITDPIDTIVRRTQGMDFTSGVGVQKTTGVQVVAISLKSPALPADKLDVSFNGGAVHEFWDVFLVHDPGQTQNPGSANFTPTTGRKTIKLKTAKLASIICI